MKKVLYIITQSELGGAQKYLLSVLAHLDMNKYTPFVAAAEMPGEIFPKIKAAGVQVFPLKHLKRNINFIEDIRAVSEMRILIRQLKPDIIHLLSSKAGFLGALAGRLEKVPKIIYRIGGFAFSEKIPIPVKIFYFLAEWIGGYWKNLIIVNNKADIATIRRLRLFNKKTVCIPNGLDPNTEFLTKDLARKKFCIPENIWVIGAIANFYPNKGLNDLLNAAKLLLADKSALPPFKIIIIGDGLERKNLENFIQKHGLSETVVLAGKIPDAEKYIKAFDLFVLPSKKEGMPWVILEAFAAQIPVIATVAGGIPTMINNGEEGILINIQNPEELALAIKKLWFDKNLQEFLTKNAFNRLKREFGLEKMVKATEMCYQ